MFKIVDLWNETKKAEIAASKESQSSNNTQKLFSPHQKTASSIQQSGNDQATVHTATSRI